MSNCDVVRKLCAKHASVSVRSNFKTKTVATVTVIPDN